MEPHANTTSSGTPTEQPKMRSLAGYPKRHGVPKGTKRRPSEVGRPYADRLIDEDRWRPIHTRILIDYVQRGPAPNLGELSKKFKLTKQYISIVINSPYFIQRAKEMALKVEAKIPEAMAKRASIDKAREVLVRAAYRCAIKVRVLSKNGTSKDRLQFDACRDILDRAGLKPKEIIETHERGYTPEEIDSALETLREVESIIMRLSNTSNPFIINRGTGTGSETEMPALNETPRLQSP